MNWRDMALTPGKDNPMPETKEHYLKMLVLDDELIHEQRIEISKLKVRINKLELKLQSQKSRN